jgi:hypothetical protein
VVKELMQRVVDAFKPYSLEDFILDYEPQNHYDVERAQKEWAYYNSTKAFTIN